MESVFDIFKLFLKIGFSIHGGGYVMIGVTEREVVDKKGWLDAETYQETISLCQSLPGPIAVTAAFFVGYKLKGVKGAFACLFGILIPAFFTILILAAVLVKFSSNTIVKHALHGIEAAVPMLILVAVVNFFKKMKKSIHNIIYGIVALIALIYFKINPAILVIFSAIYGIIVYRYIIKEKKGDR